MDIEFVADEWYDLHRTKIAWFTAIVDEKSPAEYRWKHSPTILALFTTTLCRLFGAIVNLQNTAARVIEQCRFEADGRFIIRSADLRLKRFASLCILPSLALGK